MSARNMLQKVLEERARVWEQAKELNDTVLEENRDYSGEENEKYERMAAELSKFDGRIRDLTEQVEQDSRADEARALLDHDPRPTGAPPEARESDSDMIRRLASGELRHFDFERRDLTVGTSTAGGDTVPTGFVNQLYEHMIEVSAIRQANPTVLTTGQGNDLQVPKTTADSTASLISEAAAISESDPTFGQVTLQAFKYAILIQTSSELLQDTGVDLTGYLARQAGRALGNASGAHFTTGDGSSKPRGIVTAATVGVTGATGNSGVPTADELIDLKYSVIAPYRRNGAVWQMSDATIGEVRKLKDSNNQYLWQPSLTAGDPDILLGHAVVVNPDVADTSTSAKSVVFGDHSAYYIRDVAGVRVERSDDFAFDTDLVTWRFIIRTDGDLVDETGAVKTFQGGAS